MKTLIIAEAGVNHNGSLSTAKSLIEVAAEAGADYIKFQSFKAEHLVTRTAPKANYQIRREDDAETQYDMLKALELDLSMHRALLSYANDCGINFLSTAFDIEGIALLSTLGVDLFKSPSGEITNLPYLRYLGSLNKRILLSTGMSTLAEIETAVKIIEEAGTPRTKLTVLHCTSAYPTPISEVNLFAMLKIKKQFGVDIGYSDHTLGIEVPIAAVALGASVVEKHFTLDRNMPGPDHKASLEPTELIQMIRMVRNVEVALGDGDKRVMPSEFENRKIARKSIVAKMDIKVGDELNALNLTTKRPGTGLSPMSWDRMLGKRSTKHYLADDLIDEA